MTRVMLLIPTASYRAPDFMAAADRLGLEVVVGSDRGQPLADQFPGKTLTASFAQPEEGAREIVRFADAYPLDAIVAVDDGGTILAAEASLHLRLPHVGLDAVRASRDKVLMRELLDAAGSDAPGWRVASFDDDLRTLAEAVSFPCVIKPVSLSGSRGVMRADDAKSLAAAVQRLRAILERPEVQEECAGDADRFLVEDFIPGIEVSVEGLVTEGGLHVLTLFDKPDPLDGPFFEETIYVTPSRLPRATQEAVAQAAERATAALGIVSGPVHAELRINDDGIYPIDIAARSIGGLCARTLTFGTGMSLEEIILRQATGAPIDSFDREEQASGVMMIPIPRSGTLHAVEGIAEAEGVSSVSEVTISIRVGRPVLALPEGAEYLGFIFARAATPEQVESALREAHQRLRFQIR